MSSQGRAQELFGGMSGKHIGRTHLNCEQAFLVCIVETSANDNPFLAELLVSAIEEDVFLLVCSDEMRLQCLNNFLMGLFVLEPQLYFDLRIPRTLLSRAFQSK